MNYQDRTQACFKRRMVSQLCKLTTCSGNMGHNEQPQSEMGEEERLKHPACLPVSVLDCLLLQQDLSSHNPLLFKLITSVLDSDRCL